MPVCWSIESSVPFFLLNSVSLLFKILGYNWSLIEKTSLMQEPNLK